MHPPIPGEVSREKYDLKKYSFLSDLANRTDDQPATSIA